MPLSGDGQMGSPPGEIPKFSKNGFPHFRMSQILDDTSEKAKQAHAKKLESVIIVKVGIGVELVH